MWDDTRWQKTSRLIREFLSAQGDAVSPDAKQRVEMALKRGETHPSTHARAERESVFGASRRAVFVRSSFSVESPCDANAMAAVVGERSGCMAEVQLELADSKGLSEDMFSPSPQATPQLAMPEVDDTDGQSDQGTTVSHMLCWEVCAAHAMLLLDGRGSGKRCVWFGECVLCRLAAAQA